MISKTLDKIQKDLDFIKEIASEENFKRLEERCDFVNTRNKELQRKINKVIKDLEETKKYNTRIADKKGNILLHIDIDHINYLIKILKGE